MIKKYCKYLAIALIAMLTILPNAFAKEMTLEEVNEAVIKEEPYAGYYYNIGQYIFTSSHILTLEDVMLAARTIAVSNVTGGSNTDSIYGEMATYQFNAVWGEESVESFEYSNNFTGTSTPGDKLDVCYINYKNICDTEEINKPNNSIGNPKNMDLVGLSNKIIEKEPYAGYFYNIGQYVFTSSHILTLEDVMLAARTIDVVEQDGTTKEDAIYGKMATYQFNAVWGEESVESFEYSNNFTGTATPSGDFKICYINYEKICDDSILVDVDALVNNAYETIKGQAATDKFEVALNGNTIDVTINDLTMSSAEALTGTGVSTALANFLTTEGIESVVLTHGDVTVTVSKDSLDATALYNFLVAVAGENSESAADLDGKEIVANITFEEGYATANSDSFNIKFKNREDIKVDVDALVNNAYETIKGQAATDKFEVALNENTVNVTIIDLTMSSAEALTGTGVSTALANFLTTEGIESVVLTHGDAELTVSKDSLDATALYNFLVAVAGENSESAADLDGKVIDAKVEFELGYVTANSDSFEIVFDVKTPAEITTTIGNAETKIPYEFEVTTKANDYAGVMVIGTSNFSNPEAIEKLEYYEVKDGKWYELTTDFGPSTGFPLSDATSKFRVTWKTAGEYTFTMKVVDVTDKTEVYAEVEKTVVVTEHIDYVDVDALVNNAYETIKGQAATDKFEVALNGNTIDVTINDLTMSSAEALTGTGVSTALANFLTTEGIESVVLTHGDAIVTVSKDSLDATALYNFLVAVAGENSESAADLDGKEIVANITFEEGYATANSDSFNIKFKNREDIKVDVDTLVNNAYETIKGQAATDKFEVALNGTEINVIIVDRTMSSAEALTGTGVSTALANFLTTEGIESVVLTHGDAELTVSKDSLDATALYNFLVAVAGENSESAADLDGKEIDVKVEFELGYVTANSDAFKIKFTTTITKVDVNALVNDAYETIKGQATDKFDVAINENTIDVTINDLTMSSAEALTGTGVSTAIANFLTTEGIESVVLTHGDAELTVSKENLDATALYNFLVAVAGENSESAVDLDGKVIDAKVTFEKWYETANIDSFNIKFNANILGYVDVDTLVNNAYETIKGQAATDKFDVAINGNQVTVILIDTEMSSAEALTGTGVSTAIANFLTTEGIKSVTLTHGDDKLVVSKDNLDADELYNFLVAIAGENSESAADLVGKTIKASVELEQGYLTKNSDEFEVTFKEIEKYTVSFDSKGGNTVDSETVIIGTKVTEPTAPTKEGHTFKYWTLNGVEYDFSAPVVEDMTLVAEWEVNKHTVTWIVDGTETKETYEYGTTPSFKGTTDKAADAQYTYTFAGWDTTIVPVTGDVTYTAKYDKTVNKYTVTWANEDGTVLDTDEVEYGTVPSYAGTKPTKVADETYTYEFADWNKEVVAVTGDVTYKATYTPTYINYTVKFVVDGETVSEKTYHYGDNVTVPADPTKDATAQYTYTFKDWGSEVTTVTGDTTYTAVFTETVNKYTVTWIVDGTETEETYEYGTTPSFKGTTDKAADAQYTYTFAGWDTTIAPVTGDATYTAKYDKTVNKYTVTWIVDGTETEETYEYGTTPAFKGTTDKAADAQYTYTFSGWDTTIAPVTGDVTYTAKYDKTVNKYTVTWANEDGTVLDTDEVEYGTVPSYTGTKPTKAADQMFTYEFADWDKEVVAVTGDVTYKATYTQTYVEYTITFIIDGEVASEKTYHYGDRVEVPNNPSKAADAQYTYTFAGWDKAVTIVEGNATYTAKFNSTVNEYTVTYVDASNNTLGTEKVKYGTLVSTLTAPTKEGYEFDSFDVDGTTTITGDTTLVVNYNKIVNVEESLQTNLATVETDDLLKLDVADNKINALFASEDTNMLLIFDPIVDVLEQITSNEAYESVVVSYNGKTLVLSDLDYSKLGLINFMLKEEDATEVARFIAWVALGSGSGSDIANVTPKDLIGKSLDVEITLADGNISENSNLIEYYDLVFGLTTEETVAVTYDANGGTFIDGETSKINAGYFAGNTIVEPELLAREGYTFSGWYNGSTKFDFSTKVTEDLNLVANWKANEYTVTWVTAKETINETYEYGTTPSFSGSTAKDADETYTYTFTGWDTEIVPVIGDVTYTAQYSKEYINYTVEFVADGEVISTATYHYGDTVVVPANPTKAETTQYTYTFTGWDNEVTTVTGNTTYTAVFEETLRKYTVNFVVDGETITAKVSYGTVMTAPPLTKDGYTLNGWYTDSELTTTFDFTTAITGDVTVYATWTPTYTTDAYTDTNGDVTLNFAAVNGSGSNRERNRTVTITEEEGTEIVSVNVTGSGKVSGGIVTTTGTDNPTVTENSYTINGEASGWFNWELSKTEGSFTYITTITYYKYTEDSNGNRVYETDANGDKVLYTAEFTSIF